MSRMIPRSRQITCGTCHQDRFVESGAELRALRKRAKLRLADIASRAKVGITTVYGVEHDHHIASPAVVAVYQSVLEELDRTAS